MNKRLYFEGRQIKNYLVGFASLFAEIPYKNRKGKIDIVPIMYGSPSDIISYLERNVDNDETKNVNRLKDISIPLFSFRLISLEKNNEKRRAPLDTITVDLRPLGYQTGYVAMRPTPNTFTFELTLWASSDYQAFEIIEQIIPYFNSPQQVTIEPLPRCPVSTTEIFLQDVQIDTEPDSQKYSAQVTMTFSLTGWLLTQPKIWSTNMKFEFSMLDKTDPDGGVNLTNPFDKTFEKYNIVPSDTYDTKPSIQKLDVLTFLRTHPEIAKKYGEYFDIYKILTEEQNYFDKETGALLKTDETTIIYKDEEIKITSEQLSLLADKMNELKFIMENEELQEMLKTHKLEDSYSIIKEAYDEDAIEVFVKMYDMGYISDNFEIKDTFNNTAKMQLFGKLSKDVESPIKRFKTILSTIEDSKLNSDYLLSQTSFNPTSIVHSNNLENEADETKSIIKEIIKDKTNINLDDLKNETLIDNGLVLRTLFYVEFIKEQENGYFVRLNRSDFEVIDIETNKSIEITNNTVVLEKKKYLLIRNNEISLITIKDDFDDSNYVYDIDQLKLTSTLPEIKLLEVTDYVTDFIYFLYFQNQYKQERINNNLYFKFEEDFEIKYDSLISNYLKKRNYQISDFFKNVGSTISFINLLKQYSENYPNSSQNTQTQSIPGTDNVLDDLYIKQVKDENDQLLYDLNNDGLINETDIEYLGLVFPDPSEIDFKVKFGMWYKQFDITKVKDEILYDFKSELKLLDYKINERVVFPEFEIYIDLLDKGIVDYWVLPTDDEKRDKMKLFGYNENEVQEEFLKIQKLEQAVTDIFNEYKELTMYYFPEITETDLLEIFTKINFKDVVIGIYLEHNIQLLDFDSKSKFEQKCRNSLSKSLGYYYDEVYNFNQIFSMIRNNDKFEELVKDIQIDNYE